MRKFLFTLFLLALVGLPVFAYTLLDDRPLVAEIGAPTPEDVATTKDLVYRIREATSDDAPPGLKVNIPIAEANAALKLGARVLPGFRAQAWIRQGRVEGEASVPIPLPWGRKWLNVEAIAPPFEDGLRLDALRVGGWKLPPGLSIQAGRVGANLVIGSKAGDKILSAASAMDVEDEEMVFTMALSRDSRGEVMEGVFGTLRGGDMPTGEDIDAMYVAIRDAIEDGTLPDEGSFLPHLQFTLQMALERADDRGVEFSYTTAIFALSKACGAWGYTVVIGGLAGKPAEELGTWTRDCGNITVRDRHDSRLHFITAAALKAASNRGFAVGVGEFKELYDSLSGDNGFDFTDLAANNSGIRLSDRMMAAPLGAWPELVARIGSEDDVVVDFTGIPGRIPDADFRARFGDIDSAEYAAMVGQIEARIDALAVHRN